MGQPRSITLQVAESTPPTVPEVPEADKPFYLVILLTAVFVGLLVYVIHEGNGVFSEVKDILTGLLTLLAAGYGLYFRSKS